MDGDVDGALWNGSASATNINTNSWWQVDLQSIQNVSSITVWGRTDCCPEMTSNFYVFVSNTPFTSYDLNATINQAGVSNYYHSGFAGPSSTTGPTSINVNRTGRYVRVQLATTQYLVLGEVQVWSQAAKINWTVTDHLGTPRMVVDKTGSTAGVSRHDYLPFGEEIFAGTAGRTTQQGYVGDTVRQQFTQKERDLETGLDYFLARYYSSMQGRFTSPDEPFADQFAENPQSWNLYSYVRNNPLVMVDPTGRRTGDYYNRDGTWAFTDNLRDDRVYVLNETREGDGSVNLTPQLLGIAHTQFRTIANIVRQEAGTANAQESLWIAHTSNNEASAIHSSLYNLLQTSFSSAGDKVNGIGTNDSSDRANAARGGVLDVLAGAHDPTSGARRWDGTDFLAWGLNSPDGTPHNKFEEFTTIDIPSATYNAYLNAQRARWGNSVPYYGTRYNLPAAVFTNTANWTAAGDFHYVTGARNATRGLTATGARGQTIFWRF